MIYFLKLVIPMFTGEESNPIQQCLPFDQFEHEGTRAFLLFEP
jgi:hypothetical protein